MVYVVGITGSIATGKSTVTRHLISKGYTVLDSDMYAREALLVDSDCITQVKEQFACVENGEINRKKLGNIVFHDEEARHRLEAIIHPYVIQQLKKGIAANKDKEIIFLDIPLLYECHLEFLCDTILVVYCQEEIQLQRLMKRDSIDITYAKTIMKNQISIEKKKEKANIMIDNSNTIEATLQQIDALW